MKARDKKITEELNEWNKINEEIKLLDSKKLNNNKHIINKIDKIKENLKNSEVEKNTKKIMKILIY